MGASLSGIFQRFWAASNPRRGDDLERIVLHAGAEVAMQHLAA
jgi:hypothetical protein